MKKRNIILLAVMAAILFSSCVSTRDSYASVNGKLTGIQSQRSLNYIDVQKAQRLEVTADIYTQMDINRLKNQAVRVDSSNGYQGKIINLSRWYNVQFNVARIDGRGGIGRTILSEFLAPGQQTSHYLLPGRYFCSVIINGKLTDQKELNVNSEMYSFFGEKTHWYIYWDKR